MKQPPGPSPIMLANHGHADAINYGRILGLMRRAHPRVKPTRLKFRRLKARSARSLTV